MAVDAACVKEKKKKKRKEKKRKKERKSKRKKLTSGCWQLTHTVVVMIDTDGCWPTHGGGDR